jgi:ABC-type Fe3+/spermidine/putrescine transport system ATPase subunit
VIALEGVSLGRGGFSLREVSLIVARGEYHFLVGPSGAGTTLLLEVMAGLHPDATGRVIIGGRDMTGVPPERRNVALVYQDYALFPHLTVRENVAFGPGVRGLPGGRIDQLVRSLLERFGLAGLGDRSPGTLSGGERQRVALARALATEPEVLLLDEPFAAVDPPLRARFMREMKELQREKGLTVVQVSHARDEALALADRVAVISGGRILQAGTVEEVFRRPVSREVARIAGIENLVQGMVIGSPGAGTEVLLPGGARILARTLARAGGTVTACIPAAEIRLVPGGACALEGSSAVPGTVTGIVPGEHTVLVELDCGFPLVARVTGTGGAAVPPIGTPVTAIITEGSVHLIAEEGGGEGE